MKTQEHHDNGKVVTCCATISFTDDDLLMGCKPHNRPLLVVGSIQEQHLNRILVDDGSAVNIMPKMVLIKLGISIDELSKSNLTIQGFNQGGQRAIGMIRMVLSIDDMKSNTLIHVIDAKTSYNLLLGRPWIHENGVVSSTLHQCLKYRRDGEIVKIDVDIKPFTETESYFADAKFYLDSCEPSVEKPSSVDEADVKSKEENEAQWTTTKLPKKKIEEVSIELSSSQGDIQTKTDKEHLVFRYVPRERRKKGQPLLHECTSKKQMSHKDIQHLKEHMTIPVAQIPYVTFESTKGNLQADKIKEHYDRKAFILLEKSGYDFSNPSQLGEVEDEVTGEKIHGLNESQMKLRKQGHYVATPKFGLEFSLAEPLRISSKRSKRDSFITIHLDRGDEGRTTRKSPSGKILSKHKEQVHEERDHFEVVADKEICSAFPSRMKRKSILSISTNGPLKVQRRTIVYTCHPRKEAEKENEAMPTIQESQREKSDFVETTYHITVEDSPCLDVDDEVHEAPPQLEDGGQSTEEEEYSKLLTEYKDVFAWSYKEIPGLSPKVAVHHLGIKSGARPVKQSQCMFRPELVFQIKVEVNKLIEAGFIREVKYPSWISNIVPVKKKNGQIRVCVDFRDLNKACPKDDFPLPIIELMVEATTGHEAMLFMDGSSGYNQTRMSPKDEECTAFRTPKGIYCYKVMPIGLKNAGATYQRAMQNIFDDMLHKRVECYVDDLVVKTKNSRYHLEDLRIIFERLRKFDLKMNPLKCAFGVTSGKFFVFIVRHRGIEVDPAKIDAI
ncbi:PREDICTED: uncharacterized protein LOC109240565 [Nicotiana attenuata]|uniref:uncharacterized protein LOC109240565 n=1 Tax=Nicotiana attenuata TaxID=49451 RepID=UPI0009054D9C|nr:PREDICTED: uncharacterized protein LOC109240565 [Nicotiana attenuata]